MRYLPGEPHQLPGNRTGLENYHSRHLNMRSTAGLESSR